MIRFVTGVWLEMPKSRFLASRVQLTDCKPTFKKCLQAQKVLVGEEAALPQGLESASEDDLFTDVFIAGSGESAEAAYANIETRLARSAAVNFIDGDLTVPIRSRHAHYVSNIRYVGECAMAYDQYF